MGEKKDELKNKVEQIKVLEPGRQQRCARMLNSVHWSHGMRNEQAELNHTHKQVLPGPSASHCLALVGSTILTEFSFRYLEDYSRCRI